MLIGVQSVASSYANPIVYKPPEITVFSPSQGGLYNTSDVALNFTVKLYGYTYSGNLENIQWLNYSLDSQV